MTGGGPLPVREFASVSEMLAHVAAVRERLMPSAPVRHVVLPPARQEVPAVKLPDPPVIPDIEPMLTGEADEVAASIDVARAQDAERRTSRTLIKIASEVTRFPASAIIGERRMSSLIKARFIAVYLLKSYTKLSLPQIGRRMGGRDHTTILHALRRVQKIRTLYEIPESADPADLALSLWEVEWPAPGKGGRS